MMDLELIPKVAAWQNQRQVAYWKSRALALEYENNMLRNVYAQQMQDYGGEEHLNVEDQNVEDLNESREPKLNRKPLQKRPTFTALGKYKRITWKILRRKRSKLKYWRYRKGSHLQRKSDDLSSTSSVFNITDMEDIEPIPETLNRKPLQKRPTFTALGKYKWITWRILQRKRSKLKYWRYRKGSHLKRQSDDLSSTSSVFTDTEDVKPIPETSAGQNQHQVAYWKSHALALENENYMLRKHIRDVYAQQIQYYSQYMEEEDEDQNVEDSNESQALKLNRNWQRKSKEKEIWPPPDAEARQEEQKGMIAKYGSMAPKIKGMETAIQLNYDLYVEEFDPQYWPCVPLKL